MLRLLFPLLLASTAVSTNFQWERVQLTEEETVGNSDFAFGDSSDKTSLYPKGRCKIGPGDDAWPTVAEWASFNSTLGGVLLKPTPIAASCYAAEEQSFNPSVCATLLNATARSRAFLDDPLNVLTEWPTGNTCPPTASGTGVCGQGGFPIYVVNATTVRHIQLAINFARNRNLRLVIKNTGHDFNGRNTGWGALSIWTHHLKEFEFLPSHEVGPYNGRVARVSAGIETWEIYNYMSKFNMTMAVPGGDTVGPFGGWIAGGGHHFFSSLYGQGSDQILGFQAVTADGKYVTVSPSENEDLFFAMLGGGGSTYGVLTSALVKAYPKTYMTNIELKFEVGSVDRTLHSPPAGNFSRPRPENGSLPSPPRLNATRPSIARTGSIETFWDGVWLYQYFSPVVQKAGGTLYSYVRPPTAPNGTNYAFEVLIKIPRPHADAARLVAPLYRDLGRIGIPAVADPVDSPDTSSAAQATRTGLGGRPRNGYFGSRLFPTRLWDNTTVFNATFAAIRAAVEAGYTFHGVDHHAPLAVAGYPGNLTAVSPVWRDSYMHADLFESSFQGFHAAGAAARFWEAYRRFNASMDGLRRATPGGGAYVNEADVLEPNWQGAFYSGVYERLLEVKRRRDPWGLFWAPTTPGSEAWAVENGFGSGGLPTQNGRLCRIE